VKKSTPKAVANQAGGPRPARNAARRWLALIAILATIAALGMVGYWLATMPIEPPAVDLGKVDPEVAEAIETARKKVLSDSASAAAWGELAQVLHVHDFNAEAMTCYAEAERRDPADPRWPYLQSICLGTTDPDKRLACLRRAVDRGNRDPVLVSALAEALLELDRFEEAEPLLQDILKRDANNAYALYGTAKILIARGDLAGGKTHLERSLARQNQVRGPHLLLAQVCEMLGDKARADQERRLAHLITIERYWTDPYLDKLYSHEAGVGALLKRAVRLSVAGNPAAAERFLIDAVRRHPEISRLHVELGKVWLFLKRVPQAEAEFREALRLDPNHLDANHYLGICLRAQKRYAEANEFQQQALKVQSQFAAAWFESGLCLEALGNRDGAMQAYREAVRRSPEMGQAHKQLGMLLRESNSAEARVHLQQAALLMPDDDEVKKQLAELPKSK
jgi:tetratricopeptide (TPR) repeat protein